MTTLPPSGKLRSRGKLLRGLGLAAVGFAGLWLITWAIGSRDVRQTVLANMSLPGPRSEFRDVSSLDKSQRVLGNTYYCRTVTYAPLLVRADFGWGAGSLSGAGGSALYLWLLGRSFLQVEFNSWAE
jgi:hypothetical protein